MLKAFLYYLRIQKNNITPIQGLGAKDSLKLLFIKLSNVYAVSKSLFFTLSFSNRYYKIILL